MDLPGIEPGSVTILLRYATTIPVFSADGAGSTGRTPWGTGLVFPNLSMVFPIVKPLSACRSSLLFPGCHEFAP